LSGVASAGGAKLFTKQFVRTTADGVAIRVYQTPLFPPPGAAGCPVVFTPLDVEVSTPDVVATVPDLLATTVAAPFKAVSLTLIGTEEGAPVWVVTAEATAGVAKVQATFADGKTDQMAPVGGWAVLAHVVPAGDAASPALTGTITALNGAGKVLASTPFPSSPFVGQAPIAGVAPGKTVSPAQPAGGSVSSSAGEGTGATTTVTAQSGAAGGGWFAAGGAAASPNAPTPLTTTASPPGQSPPPTNPPTVAPSCPFVPSTATTTGRK
jgi:hypothetical protein